VTSILAVRPQNNVVLSYSFRNITAFNCVAQRGVGVNWLYYDVDYPSGGSPCYIYKFKANASPGDFCNDTTRFYVTPWPPTGSSLTSFDLVIDTPQFSDAGTYVCAEVNGTLEQAAAILGVLRTRKSLLTLKHHSNSLISLSRLCGLSRGSLPFYNRRKPQIYHREKSKVKLFYSAPESWPESWPT